MTLTEFLLARIAEDESWANAAIKTPGATHWHWVDPESDAPLSPDPFAQEDTNDGEGASLRTVEELKPVAWDGAPLPDFIIWQTDEVTAGAAGHIARHDPARVLAECEAKRQIIALHTEDTLIYADGSGGVGCLECDDDRDYGFSPQGFCPTLRALALPYADHPDYREEWRP